MDPAPQSWHSLCCALSVDPQVGQRIWHALMASPHPKARIMVYETTRFDRSPQARTTAGCRAFLNGPASPSRLCAVIEVLVAEARLSRMHATAMEEAALSKVLKSGDWC